MGKGSAGWHRVFDVFVGDLRAFRGADGCYVSIECKWKLAKWFLNMWRDREVAVWPISRALTEGEILSGAHVSNSFMGESPPSGAFNEGRLFSLVLRAGRKSWKRLRCKGKFFTTFLAFCHESTRVKNRKVENSSPYSLARLPSSHPPHLSKYLVLNDAVLWYSILQSYYRDSVV